MPAEVCLNITNSRSILVERVCPNIIKYRHEVFEMIGPNTKFSDSNRQVQKTLPGVNFSTYYPDSYVLAGCEDVAKTPYDEKACHRREESPHRVAGCLAGCIWESRAGDGQTK